MTHPFDAVTEEEIRKRQSKKWRHYPADVLPAWVAEMDYPLAEPIRRVLERAVADNDCGYPSDVGIREAFAAWAAHHQGWPVDPRDVWLVADVMTGIAEIVRVGTSPGDRIVIDPPVYPPFAATVRDGGRVIVEAPLARDGDALVLDLVAIERAYASGARMHLFCSPHNPAGRVHRLHELERLAELADHFGVLVLSDEIHAPLTLEGAVFRPFVLVSEAARRRGIVLTSASKTWNIAGLKAALIIGTSDDTRAVLRRLSSEMPYHVGHLGVLAGRAAFEEGEIWRTQVLAILARNRALLSELLAEHLPEIRYRPPEAGYLAWLDCRGLSLGDDPSRAFLRDGRVALSPGPTFGTGGAGFARLNFATSRALLEDVVRRMASAVR